MWFFLFLFFRKKGFFPYIKNTFNSRPLLMHDLRGNYILFLKKSGTTKYGLSSLFSYVSAKLRIARYLILSVPMSLLVRVSVRFIENSGQSCGFISL